MALFNNFENKYTYVFININIPQYTSFLFYFNMINNIKKVLSLNNIKYHSINNIDEAKTLGPNIILIVDVTVIYTMLRKYSDIILKRYPHKINDINELLKYKYILI